MPGRIALAISFWMVVCCPPARAAGPGEGYLDDEALGRALQALPAEHPDACRAFTVGHSRVGRELWALELARGAGREQRAALAIVAGLDGDYPVGTAVAVGLARRLLAATGDDPGAGLLDRHVVYVIPCANPDAVASFFETPRREQRAALRPVDDDRDGLLDEDGPSDLNGDGLVTLMRVPLEGRRIEGLDATHLPDPLEPRLLKKAARDKGETPLYAVLLEGLDDDDDGAYNEDGPGGVDLDRNFTHEYREHTPGAGPHQISEPESRALIDFFIAHPRIAATIVYGRHDNLVKAPKGGSKKPVAKPRAPGRRQPRKPPSGLHEDDVAFYKTLHEKYVELTGIKEVPDEPRDGALFAWAYAEYGIPSLACRVWARPPREEHKDHTADAAAGAKAASPDEPRAAKADAPPDDAAPAADGPAEPHDIGEQAPGKPEAAPPGARPDRKPGKKEDKPANAEDAAWLKYSDEQRDGSGFVPWAAYDHPQLGPVEIGGFVPFFRTTPPAAELNALTAAQPAFAVDVAGRLPAPALSSPRVRKLSETLFEVELTLRNDGYFPTALGIGRLTRRVGPIVITLQLPPEDVVGGSRVERLWSIPGSSGQHHLRWILRGEPAARVEVRMTSRKFGDRTLTVELKDTP